VFKNNKNINMLKNIQSAGQHALNPEMAPVHARKIKTRMNRTGGDGRGESGQHQYSILYRHLLQNPISVNAQQQWKGS